MELVFSEYSSWRQFSEVRRLPLSHKQEGPSGFQSKPGEPIYCDRFSGQGFTPISLHSFQYERERITVGIVCHL
jgi:hypothetical protein